MIWFGFSFLSSSNTIVSVFRKTPSYIKRFYAIWRRRTNAATVSSVPPQNIYIYLQRHGMRKRLFIFIHLLSAHGQKNQPTLTHTRLGCEHHVSQSCVWPFVRILHFYIFGRHQTMHIFIKITGLLLLFAACAEMRKGLTCSIRLLLLPICTRCARQMAETCRGFRNELFK